MRTECDDKKGRGRNFSWRSGVSERRQCESVSVETVWHAAAGTDQARSQIHVEQTEEDKLQEMTKNLPPVDYSKVRV